MSDSDIDGEAFGCFGVVVILFLLVMVLAERCAR